MSEKPWIESGKPFFNAWRLGTLGIFALSVLMYLPDLWGRPVFEDPLLISGDGTGGTTLMGAFTHPFLSSYYRPLTSASFILDRHFADTTTSAFHVTNILLHAVTAVLIAYLTLLLTRKDLAGILAGVCFAIQPAQLGAVAWIGGRTDVLSTFFIVIFLTALLLYFKTGKTGWCVGSAAAFLLALLSKEQSMALLLSVPLGVFVFGSKKMRDAVVLTVPFLACIAAMVALSRLPAIPIYGNVGEFNGIQMPILTAADYASSFIVPTHSSQLTFSFHNFQGGIWLAVGVLALAAAAWLGVILWNRNRSLAWIYLCGLLLYLPVSNLIPIPSFWVGPYRMSETGACLACVFGAAGAYVFSSRRLVLSSALAANLALGGIVTWIGTHDWTSGPKLSEAVLKLDPYFVQSRLFMIDDLFYKHRNAEALASSDDLASWLFGTPDWTREAASGNVDRLRSSVISRLRTNFGKPSADFIARVVSRESKALLLNNRPKDAETVTRDGLFFAPNDADLNYEYGCEIMTKNRAQAIRYWETSLYNNPNLGPCQAMLGQARFEDGRYREAEPLLAKAAAQLPFWGQVWVDLADARVALRDYQGALRALDMASQAIYDKNAIARRRAKIQSLLNHPRVARR